MLSGKTKATLLEVHPYDVHGQPNWLLRWRPDGAPEGTARESHLATESVYPDPRPGDRIEVDLLMGEATEVRRA